MALFKSAPANQIENNEIREIVKRAASAMVIEAHIHGEAFPAEWHSFSLGKRLERSETIRSLRAIEQSRVFNIAWEQFKFNMYSATTLSNES